MEFTGRTSKGFVFAGPGATRKDKDLQAWVFQALAYNKTILARPKKKPGGKKPPGNKRAAEGRS